MGDPRKTRKKYSTPSHPWQKTRIEEESEITNKYALRNKKEIWKMNSMLKGFKKQAKKISSLTTKQSEKEKKLLTKKLVKIGLLKEGDRAETVLILKLEDIMERRLQTIVCRKNLARTMKQARQFITHGHIKLNEKVNTSPAHIVLKNEEDMLKFSERSALSDPENPERQIAKPVKNKEETKEEKKTDKKEKKTEDKKEKAEAKPETKEK